MATVVTPFKYSLRSRRASAYASPLRSCRWLSRRSWHRISFGRTLLRQAITDHTSRPGHDRCMHEAADSSTWRCSRRMVRSPRPPRPCPGLTAAQPRRPVSDAIEVDSASPRPPSRTALYHALLTPCPCAALVAVRSRRTNLCILATPLVFVLLLVVMQRLVDAAHRGDGYKVGTAASGARRLTLY